MPRPNVAALKREYRTKGLDRDPETFVLYRILGNDLPPRHRQGQTLKNLTFILTHEPSLEGCEKRWVVNRIFDPESEAAVIQLLHEHNQPYLRIPFDWDAYAKVGWDWSGFPGEDFFRSKSFTRLKPTQKLRAESKLRRLKNNYVMHNNGARNAALRDGRNVAKWILPWDGNCFVTSAGWNRILRTVPKRPYLKYFVVPMARLTDNDRLLEPNFAPQAKEEPQLLFRRDALEEFSEAQPYGRRPKVQLFWRLGIPGDWDFWKDDPWDLPRPTFSREAGEYGYAGWVARLNSGQSHFEAEGDAVRSDRGRARVEGIRTAIDQLDHELASRYLKSNTLLSYDENKIEKLKLGENTAAAKLAERLRQEANAALTRGPYSVTDKTTRPPSGDARDYWHPAPYWWPDPNSPDGIPYVQRDGHRVPGTDLYEPGSEQYDRTRLQHVFDDATVLALAWRVSGQSAYAQHGARLVRDWFIDPVKGMHPHLRYAQVALGHNDNEGAGFGIIEMKDLYFLLDAVRLLERSGSFDERDRLAFVEWLNKYFRWLLDSPQGKYVRNAQNNQGTFYDLQVTAIAAYLGQVDFVISSLQHSSARMLLQFDSAGSQPRELARAMATHYSCFNLQGWINLAELAAKCGTDLWGKDDTDHSTLKRGLEWFFNHHKHHSSVQAGFEESRLLPLSYSYQKHYCALPAIAQLADPLAQNPILNPHYAVKPFWMLGH